MIRGALRRMQKWPAGFYEGPALYNQRLVVLSELPRRRDTLLLRLMGAGKTLEKAIEELKLLPAESWEWQVAMPALVALRVVGDYTAEEEAERQMIIQNVQELYTAWEQRTLAEGEAKGAVHATRRLLRESWELRFGPAPDQLIHGLESCDDIAELYALHRLFLMGSPAEILEQLPRPA